jgi:ectoine hydroxylase-related dioxygenase (phytanoyl-CoA dioxygenase family)
MAAHQSVGEIKERGYTVLEGALDAATLARFRAELQPFLDDGPFGRNDFEGHRSKRVYAMLAKTPTVAALVEHPDVLAMVDEFLMPNYLLTSCLAIDLHPGETRQSFHFDDGGTNQPRPRKPAGISTIWAIDDFTDDNGATEVIPGSHLWGDETPDPDSAEFVKVTMPAGSVVVFAGTLWHRGGSNDSDANRLGITPQYCEPWARQLENMILAVGPKAMDYSDRIKSMLGYSITPPFMGYVDGRHPMKCLDGDFDPASTGDGDRSRVFWDDEYRFRAADATEGV